MAAQQQSDLPVMARGGMAWKLCADAQNFCGTVTETNKAAEGRVRQ